jgi:hypothetical protein
MSGSEFRCPFETMGERDKTILKIGLSSHRHARMREIRRALALFEKKPKSPGIKFRLPAEVSKGCESLSDLKYRVIPYQADIVAGQLEHDLGQAALFREIADGKFGGADSGKLTDLHIAFKIRAAMKSDGFPNPVKSADVAQWIAWRLYKGLEVAEMPSIDVRDTNYKGAFGSLATFGVSGVIYPLDRTGDFKKKNRGTFSFIKAPFYPKSFGRFSKDVEIVITREADFTALSPETRRNIRRKSNTVLVEHGIDVCDIEEDKQEHGGVWIPPISE